MDFLFFYKVFQNFIFSNFDLLQTFNDYGLLRMGPTFLKSLFNFPSFQIYARSGDCIRILNLRQKKNTSKEFSVELMWESHEQLEL